MPRGQVADSAPIGDDDRSRPATYRTLCVRLCDGYYFPISFATPRWRLARDASVCQSRCGAGARLFVHPNPGAPKDMADLDGVPYSKLPTGFLYRTQHIPSCKCQPYPWEPEALQRHETAVLVAAARAGDKAAAKKLSALPADKPTVLRKADTADLGGDGRKSRRSGSRSKAKVAASADSEWSDDAMMRLGRKRARGGSRSSRSTALADSDWRKSVFQAY